MKAEIISVGTELLLGQIVNTNAQYISQQLAAAGVNVFYRIDVGDNKERLTTAIYSAVGRSDIIITTGGLGPTKDDLTKETISNIFGLPLIENEEALKSIKEYFNKTHRNMTDNNRKQALVPLNGKMLLNKNGTAPGILLEHEGKIIVMLPGPPHEMKPMFDEQVLPYIMSKSRKIIKSKVLRCIGIGESSLEEYVKDLMEGSNPTVAPLASMGQVTLRITACCSNEKEALEKIKDTEKVIRDRVGEYIYGVNDEQLEDSVGIQLIKLNTTIAIAESCTGGLICHKLTNVPGISDVFLQGLVVYSNKAKLDLLKIPEQILASYGAVSEPTAVAMADGVRKLAKTDLGLAVTGIAGPGGGSVQKPVGLVYIALSTVEKTLCKEYFFTGNREVIKTRTALTALNMVRKHLLTLQN
jgi:nicotinamide-nucleotide amidase